MSLWGIYRFEIIPEMRYNGKQIVNEVSVMLQVAICDDEQSTSNYIENITAQFFRMNCVDSRLQSYQSSENLLYDLQDGIFYDLLLLDIEMPGIDGMELAKVIHDKMPSSRIIFITSHLEYAITAYEFSVFRYIPKTVIEEKLPEALKDFYKLYGLERNEAYRVEVKNHVELIPYRKILYILKNGKYAVFYLEDDKTVSVRKTLSVVFDELKGEYFYFADRGCIINLANVIGMDEAGIRLPDDRHLTISRTNIPEFKATMLRFWGKQI